MTTPTEHPLSALGDVDSKLFRLPPHVRVPRHYRVDVEPPASSKPTPTAAARLRRGRSSGCGDSGALAQETFTGRCSITFEVVTPVPSAVAARFLVLHALDLLITAEDVVVEVLPNNTHTNADISATPPDAAAVPLPGTPTGRLPIIPCVSLSLWPASETTSFEFASSLPNKRGDRFCLHVRQYSGLIHKTSKGLYHSHPDDSLFLTTHFEPTDARRVFPCYDEPAFLAVFELSVVSEAGYTAVSNTPLVRTEPIELATDGDDTDRRHHGPLAARDQPESSTTTATARSRNSSSGCLSPSTPSNFGNSRGSAPLVAAHVPATVASSTAHAAGNDPDRATPLNSFVVRTETRLRRRCFFEPTPLLHTCIVAFSVGRYVIAERFSKRRGISCRAVVPEADPLHSAWFALDLLIKAVDFFDAFFDYPLPLRKIDVVALDCFEALGMENWGMIVLAKSHMLVSESTPVERRQRITRLVGHEVCHHWFGDWAAVQWWNDLWLKEGVCRYLEYFFVDSISPSWCIWNEFVGSIMDDALLADADQASTHAVRYCRDAPRAIQDSFDHVSYGKGASILRMLFSLLSMAQMKKTFHLVLVRHGASTFGLEEFQECVEDAIRPFTRRQRRAVPASNHDSTAIPRDLPQPLHTVTTPTAADPPAEDMEDEDDEARLIRLVHQVLRMVEVPGHPYLLVRDVGSHAASPSSPSCGGVVDGESFPTTTYSVTQFRSPLTTRDTLAAYVHHRQRQRDGTIDLLTPPVDECFGWDPQKVFSPASPVCRVPLRVVEMHGRLGLSLAPRVEQLTGHTTVCPQPAVSRALVSPFTVGLAAGATHASAEPTSTTSAMSPCSVASPGAGAAPFFSYFNAGGTAVLTCDYDTATWRRLIEAVAYLTDEDRMSLTVTLSRLRPVHIGHLNSERQLGDRCTLFLEWVLALTQSPRLMTSFLWDAITDRLVTLLLLTQNSYCNAGLCELVENVFAPLHRRCLLTFFTREKPMVDSFEARIHLTSASVMKMLFLMALCHKSDYRDEAEEIRRWTFRDLFSCGGDATAVSLNTSFAGTGNSLTNMVKPHLDGASFSGSDGSFAGGGGGGLAATAATGMTPLFPLGGSGLGIGDGLCVSGAATSGPGTGGNSGGLHGPVAHSVPQAVPVRPSTDGVFFSSSVTTPQRAGGLSALLSPSVRDEAPPVRAMPGNGGGHRGLLSSSNRTHWFEETCINLKNPAHITIMQTALFYLIELGDVAAWVDVAAVVAHTLQMDVAPVEEALGLPVPTLASLTDYTQRERRTELLSSLFDALVPLVFVLDDERAFPFMARVFGHFSMLSGYGVRFLFRNTRFLTFLLTNRLITRRPLLRQILSVGAGICSNGTVIALLKVNLTSLYNPPEDAHVASPANVHHTESDTDVPDSATSSFCPAMAREIHECRQLEFCQSVNNDGIMEEEASPRRLTDSDRNDCEESIHGQERKASVASSTTFGTRSRRRNRHLPDELIGDLDTMEGNCVWVDYCCEHFERFVREARERYPYWTTLAESIAPSSCLTPLTAEPRTRGDNHDAGPSYYGGVSI